MNTPDGEEFVREVSRQAERRRENRPGGMWRGLAQIGTLGWTIALPAVGGAMLGRWIDRRFETGILWTMALLTAGLALGAIAAWRTMNREMRG